MFDGFTDRTFEFYMAIRFNNNRAFFEENRGWYEEAVKAPLTALCEDLAPTMRAIDPAFELRPARAIARIHRDTRFARDKSPYRDYSFAKFYRVGDDRYSGLGFFFDLSDAGMSVGLGIYERNDPMMRALSRALTIEPEAARRVLGPVDAAFTLHPNRIARMKPPPDLPEALAPWYGLRGFYVERDIHDFALIKSRALTDALIGHYAQLAPLYRYLRDLTPIDT